MTLPVFKKLPGVLSFQRGLILSDAAFYNVLPDGEMTPVQVVRHGIRGTQNVNKSGEAGSSVSGSIKRAEVSNIQTTDSARLQLDAEALAVCFDIRFLDMANSLFSCSPSKDDAVDLVRAYKASVDFFVARARDSAGLIEVAQRFARNILNGRWLWRNRTMASTLTVRVRSKNGMDQAVDALAVSLNHFENYSAAEIAVGALIADGLRGTVALPALNVIATVGFGVRGAVEVFPSQNYIDGKPKGFARPLYALGQPDKRQHKSTSTMDFDSTRLIGQAALRDQKVSNALRTIDTWFPAYKDYGRPIPVEPNGANLDAQVFFRDGKLSAFNYAARLNELDPDSPEGMFMIASLIRGGVFSGGAEKVQPTAKAQEASE